MIDRSSLWVDQHVHSLDVFSHLRGGGTVDFLYRSAFEVVLAHFCHKTPTLLTVGLPLYIAEHLFRANAFSEYFKQNSKVNFLLYERFQELYEALRVAIGLFFNTKIYFHPQLALPGLHLFRSTAGYPFRGGGWHMDRFAVPHKIPQRATWSITILLGEIGPCYGIEFKPDPKKEDVVHYQHRVGCATVFRSEILHRVGQMSPTVNGERLTLQAHLTFCEGYGVLFW
jgi:hypothetical protein